MTTPRDTPVRNVLIHILKGELCAEAINEVLVADIDLDAALDQLEYEEPSLTAWMEGDRDLHRMLDATMTAIARLIYRDAERGEDYNASMGKVSYLIFRLLCASAQYAVHQDRPLVAQGLRRMQEPSDGHPEPRKPDARYKSLRLRTGRRRVRPVQ